MINDALQTITQGVYLVGSKNSGRIATWLTEASADPHIILIAVGKTRATAEIIRKNGSFSVNVLEENQESVARMCGSLTNREADKLVGIDYTVSDMGNPIIPGNAACFDCKVVETFELGDHVIFAGEIAMASVSGTAPMIYRKNLYY